MLEEILRFINQHQRLAGTLLGAVIGVLLAWGLAQITETVKNRKLAKSRRRLIEAELNLIKDEIAARLKGAEIWSKSKNQLEASLRWHFNIDYSSLKTLVDDSKDHLEVNEWQSLRYLITIFGNLDIMFEALADFVKTREVKQLHRSNCTIQHKQVYFRLLVVEKVIDLFFQKGRSIGLTDKLDDIVNIEEAIKSELFPKK